VATLVCLAAAVALGLAVSVGVGLAGLRRMPLLGQLRER
jgi:hypothetical protein